eukprot:gnl/TRDRNA2_/TRDRNA2_39351_c0_seq1.p1 gnl/TRDRNA2_/TRDRNA2_39351_c0~~gnl/TRDRNA2_/TRDRNA2_39351_c0_seq1.p1  ORF type:complete len:674 (-),score=126.47 gnl/TRDRNA2_/TRDRNA2_39351_c0_seq1:119-2140(-)
MSGGMKDSSDAAEATASTEVDMEHLTCPICLEAPFLDPVTAPCGHSLDKRCYMRLTQTRTPKCPVCRKSLQGSLEVAVALRDLIELSYGEMLRRRQEDSIWDELGRGKPSADTVKYLQRKLQGTLQDVVAGAQMLLFLSGILSKADEHRHAGFPSTVLKELSDAAWSAMCRVGDGISPSLLESLSQALQEFAEASTTGGLVTLLGVAVEHCQLIWAAGGWHDDAGSAGADGASRNVAAADTALTVATPWHRIFLGVGIVCGLLTQARGRKLVLPETHVESLVDLLGELLTSFGSAGVAEERSFMPGGEPESLRGSLFDAVGLLAFVSPNGDLRVFSGWHRLRAELLIEVAGAVAGSSDAAGSDRQTSLTGIRCAARASGDVLWSRLAGASTSLSQESDEKVEIEWVGSLLRGAHLRLEDPVVVDDDSCARQLLCLLGDLHGSVTARSPLHATLAGQGGSSFHQTCSLVQTAAEHAASIELRNGTRRHELMLGVLEALDGLLGFLKVLAKADAASGFAAEGERLLRAMTLAMQLADEIEEIKTVLRVFGDVLELCASDQEAAPWKQVIETLRERPFYMGLLQRAQGAASPGDDVGLSAVEKRLQQLRLPCHTVPAGWKKSADPQSSPVFTFGGGSMHSSRRRSGGGVGTGGGSSAAASVGRRRRIVLVNRGQSG